MSRNHKCPRPHIFISTEHFLFTLFHHADFICNFVITEATSFFRCLIYSFTHCLRNETVWSQPVLWLTRVPCQMTSQTPHPASPPTFPQTYSSYNQDSALRQKLSWAILGRKKNLIKEILWSENLHKGQRTRLRGSSARKNAHGSAAEWSWGPTGSPSWPWSLYHTACCVLSGHCP